MPVSYRTPQPLLARIVRHAARYTVVNRSFEFANQILYNAHVFPETTPHRIGLVAMCALRERKGIPPRGSCATCPMLIATVLILGVVRSPLLKATPVINEIDVDQFGTDHEEFVELYNPTTRAIDFDATPHVLVFFNGGDDTPPVIDGSYRAVQLFGLLNAESFLVVGGADGPNVDIVIPGGVTNLIQNGTDAVALYEGTPDEWSTSSPPTTANLVDAIIYHTDDEDDPALMFALGLDQRYDEWNNQGSVGAIFSIARDPDGGAFETGATPTPGESNDADPPLFALPGTTPLLQEATDPVAVTLRSDGGIGALQHRILSLPRNGHLSEDGAIITGSGSTTLPHALTGPLTYLPDSAFNGIDTFEFDVVDSLDRISDPAAQELAVQFGGVVISEIMHSPGSFASPQDQRIYEFVEIFNHSNGDIALSRLDGRRDLSTDTTDNLFVNGRPVVIPASTMKIIAPGGLTLDSDEEFLCEWGLSEADVLRVPIDRYETMFSGTRVLLFADGGVLLDAVNLGPEDFWTPIPAASQSVKETFLDLFGNDLDAEGNDPLAVWPYSGPGNAVGVRLSYSGIGLGSPGWVPTGYNEDFVPLAECATPPIGACCLPDGQCVTLSDDVCAAFRGVYRGDNITCAQAPRCPAPPTGACCIPVGQCESIDPYTCDMLVGVYAGDGALCDDTFCDAQFDIVINEMDYNQFGPDALEYIELHGLPGTGLGGFILALYNGGPQQFGLYRTIVLSGEIPTNGYYVIGSAGVPNVDLVAFTIEGIQNGDPDAIALVNSAGVVVDALSYGGSFVASDGPAAGLLFEDIGVVDQAPENGDPAVEIALQRIPNGVGPWTVTSDGGLGIDGTPGQPNRTLFPAPFGACCLPDGSCLSGFEPPACATAGGIYGGDASTCDAQCPTLIGACCLPNGQCEALIEADCDHETGIFFGAGSVCAQVPPCGMPSVGACCLIGGACVVEDPFDCAQLSGDYRGDTTGCASQDCGPPLLLTINEVYRNDPSIDDQEFIELFGPGGMSLADLAVITIEGDSTTAGQQGRIDGVWLLNAFTVPGDGRFVLGDEAVPGVDFPIGTTNQLENGTATILLIQGYSAFDYPEGTDIDLDDDGAPDPGVDLGLILDGIAIVDGGVDQPEPLTDRVYFGVVVVGPHGSSAPAGVARTIDGLDTESPTDFCQLGEAGDGSDDLAIPTPAAPNSCTVCAVLGDGNEDGLIDLIDFGLFQVCYTGPSKPATPTSYPPQCLCFDFDVDGDIDELDYIAFQSEAAAD